MRVICLVRIVQNFLLRGTIISFVIQNMVMDLKLPPIFRLRNQFVRKPAVNQSRITKILEVAILRSLLLLHPHLLWCHHLVHEKRVENPFIVNTEGLIEKQVFLLIFMLQRAWFLFAMKLKWLVPSSILKLFCMEIKLLVKLKAISGLNERLQNIPN